MASIFRKPKSPYFFAAYRGPRGERVQKTTKETTRSAAMEKARSWEKLAAQGLNRTISEANTRRVVAEIFEASTGTKLQFFTLKGWLEEWLKGKKGSVAEKSAEKYKQVTDAFIAHLGERAGLSIAAIGPQDVRAFRDALAEDGRSPSTVNQTIRKVLSAPFLAAVRLGYITVNPCFAVEALRDTVHVERETFSAKQVADLLKAADEDWHGVILFGYFTGLRLRDITELQWESVDFTSSILKMRTRKTGASLTLPLHPELRTWLQHRPR